jgi:hypothetical protein
MARYNPFRPGSVISPGMFVGRIPEIEVAEAALLQTRAENPQHFIVEGERGIGKSSLFLWLDSLAKGYTPDDKTNRLSFVCGQRRAMPAQGHSVTIRTGQFSFEGSTCPRIAILPHERRRSAWA